MRWNDLWPLITEAAKEWSADNAARLGAALAYYTVFSLAPLLVIILFVIGAIWAGQAESARAEIVAQMRDLAGPEGADLIQTMLENTRPGSGGVVSSGKESSGRRRARRARALGKCRAPVLQE